MSDEIKTTNKVHIRLLIHALVCVLLETARVSLRETYIPGLKEQLQEN